MFLFLLFVLITTPTTALANCNIDSLRQSFFSGYEINNSATTLVKFRAQFSDDDNAFIADLSKKFRALGNSETDLNVKFLLQKNARMRLRDIASKSRFPVLNSAESPYDILFREDYTNDKILARAHEVRIILAEKNAAPEIVLWQFIMQKKYNPLLVNRIVVRSEPQQIFVNYSRGNFSNQWLGLEAFLSQILPEFCQ